MGDVGSARYEPALLPPCPTIRSLSYSNCQRTTHSISKADVPRYHKSGDDRSIFAGFLPDAYFSRSVARRPILMTLNRSDNWVSDHLPITVR